jgi:hypothetical protein
MIDANTTLTGYEKDIQKQKIQNDFTAGENTLNRELELKKADIDSKNLDKQLTSASTIAKIYTGSNEKITGLQLTDAQAARAQSSAEFNILNVDAKTGEPKWARELTLMELSEADTTELAKDRLENDKYQFRVTTEEGKRQYDENMTWMQKQWGNDVAFREWKAGLDYDIASKNLENNKLATENERTNFSENLAFLKTQAKDENRYRTDSLNLSREVALAQLQDADLTRVDSMRQFADNLEWMKTQGSMNDTLQRDLQSQALTAQMTQFNINTENGMKQWSAQFNESVNQFKLTNAQQYDLATQQLGIARSELKGNQEAQELTQILAIFNLTQVQSYFKTKDKAVLASFTENLMMTAASGDIDFTSTIAELMDEEAITKYINRTAGTGITRGSTDNSGTGRSTTTGGTETTGTTGTTVGETTYF